MGAVFKPVASMPGHKTVGYQHPYWMRQVESIWNTIKHKIRQNCVIC